MEDWQTTAIKKGLMSYPKYLPNWYGYDKYGSTVFAKALDDSRYYRAKAEICLLQEHSSETVAQVRKPCYLLDLGCGTAAITKPIINAILKKQKTLTYFPVDIASDLMDDTCRALKEEYGDSLSIKPIAGDYTDGIKVISENRDNDVIIWFNSILNESIEAQICLLKAMAEHMKGTDRLVIGVDITTDGLSIERAYGTEGPNVDLSMNTLNRLNREFAEGQIDMSKFSLRFEYIENKEVGKASYARTYIVSLCQQSLYIAGLGINLSLTEGEPINPTSWGGTSHKYTVEQFTHIAEKGNQKVLNVWVDEQKHAGIFCLKSATVDSEVVEDQSI